MRDWPRVLMPATGPFRADSLDGGRLGMGAHGPVTCSLYDEGLVPVDKMANLTLFVLSNQPRDPVDREAMPGGGGGVAGGIWVRERFTIHRSLGLKEAFTTAGALVGLHVRRGRRYGTNVSETRDAAGRLAATNVSVGLLSYRADDSLDDGAEGQPPDEVATPGPDWTAASANPCTGALRGLRAGDAFGGHDMVVGLDLMRARDTDDPDNPIHSDLEQARRAGLSSPIAGGSHVLAFAVEALLAAVGGHALFHGAAFDVRWKAPVHAEATITPTARVTEAALDRVVVGLEATLADGTTAMDGTVTVPLAAGPADD